AGNRVRFGHRRLRVMLRHKGWSVNAKRVPAVYRGWPRSANQGPQRRISLLGFFDRMPGRLILNAKMLSGTEMPNASDKHFDLNIEKILEGWELCHAIRELIANALDEQALTGTKEPYIFKDGK